MRLIDADALKRYLNEQVISEQPTIDPVKHGWWIQTQCGVECSNCTRSYRIEARLPTLMPEKPWWNFCPACGAKMDEVSG